MFDDIFETVVKGSRTIFLDVPSKEYFSNYNRVDKATAQEMANDYFQMKEKDGVPHVDQVEEDNAINIVKIKINVQYDTEKKLEPYIVPDIFNMNMSK